jgi:LysM repeat protein/Na+-transporting methylmalonyl-CoA/oxaloacetate decarboxylase gamma subunit
VASTIGLKIANGEFYSIMDENSIVKKRLVLTTVHDKQRSVQIDLYKSFTKTMADALYIGSLVVENIKLKPKGEPSIEMVISSTGEGDITADAIDLDSSTRGEHHYLNVSLKSLDEANREYEIPDFELEQHESPPTGLYEQASVIKKETRSFPWMIMLIVGLAIILLCLTLWFFLVRSKGASIQPKSPPRAESAVPAPRQPAVQPVPDQTAQSVAPAASVPVPSPATPAIAPAQPASPPPPVIQAPPASQTAAKPVVNRTRLPAPVATYKVPATIPKDGAPYKIRWGDTLWDISEAFYRNPWLYPRIARFNKIRNPDLIISGTTIRIPPRN